jgi:hypothetical protein
LLVIGADVDNEAQASRSDMKGTTSLDICGIDSSMAV